MTKKTKTGTKGITEPTIAPIKEVYIKDLAHLKKIYKDSQINPKADIYPIFRLNNLTDPDNLYFCHWQEIGETSFGYVFYTPQESDSYGDFDYYILTEGGPEPDLAEVIEPDELIYTGQNFSEARHKIESKDETEFFTVQANGKKIEYTVFQASALDLAESNQIVLGAWYFTPEDAENFPFSIGYKTKQNAKNAAWDDFFCTL
jgi:hypothetical protein